MKHKHNNHNFLVCTEKDLLTHSEEKTPNLYFFLIHRHEKKTSAKETYADSFFDSERLAFALPLSFYCYESAPLRRKTPKLTNEKQLERLSLRETRKQCHKTKTHFSTKDRQVHFFCFEQAHPTNPTNERKREQEHTYITHTKRLSYEKEEERGAGKGFLVSVFVKRLLITLSFLSPYSSPCFLFAQYYVFSNVQQHLQSYWLCKNCCVLNKSHACLPSWKNALYLFRNTVLREKKLLKIFQRSQKMQADIFFSAWLTQLTTRKLARMWIQRAERGKKTIYASIVIPLYVPSYRWKNNKFFFFPSHWKKTWFQNKQTKNCCMQSASISSKNISQCPRVWECVFLWYPDSLTILFSFFSFQFFLSFFLAEKRKRELEMREERDLAVSDLLSETFSLPQTFPNA